MSDHEITVTTEVGRKGPRDFPESGEPGRVRREARCTCGWWQILHDETPEQIQAMHTEVTS